MNSTSNLSHNERVPSTWDRNQTLGLVGHLTGSCPLSSSRGPFTVSGDPLLCILSQHPACSLCLPHPKNQGGDLQQKKHWMHHIIYGMTVAAIKGGNTGWQEKSSVMRVQDPESFARRTWQEFPAECGACHCSSEKGRRKTQRRGQNHHGSYHPLLSA